MKTLKSSNQGLIHDQSDHPGSTPKPKSIRIPTIFDDGEAYDSPILTPDPGSYKFWATEDTTEALKLEATLHNLTAGLSKLYIPEQNVKQIPHESSSPFSLQSSSEKDVDASPKDLKDVCNFPSAAPLAPSSSTEEYTKERELQQIRPCHTVQEQSLKRIWSVFKAENIDDDQHEPAYTTTPQSRTIKRIKSVSAITDLRVSHQSDRQTPTFTSLESSADGCSVVGTAPAALASGASNLPMGSYALKRKRSLPSGYSASKSGQQGCTEFCNAREDLAARLKRVKKDCACSQSQPPRP